MPLYDYVCGNCGLEHDILHDLDQVKKKCPSCGKLKLRRAWSQVAAYHNHFSPMHPRVNRGIGNTGIRKDKNGKK